MLAITNDSGDTLQLTPGQNLVTEQNVPWLSDEELPGEFSYPIDVPLNDANKRFVAQGYRPDSTQPRSEIAVTVQMEGVLYRRCTFRYRINQGKLSGYLIIDASEFYDKIRKLSLLEALNETVFLGDGLVSTPPVDLPTRIKQIAALPPGNFPCTFFPLRNQAMLESSFDTTKLAGFVRNDYVNAWEKLPSGQFGFPVDLPNAPKFGYLICPQFYLSYVLRSIMKLAGYQIESDWLADEETQRIVIKNLTAMNQTVTDLGDLITGHKLIPGLFLPDMSVGDFLKAVKGKFGLVFVYNANTKVCRITQLVGTIQKGAAIDLTPYQTGDYSTSDKDGKGYSVSDYIDPSDELYKDQTGKPIVLPAQTIGKAETAVTLKAGTCQLAFESSKLSTDAMWFVPTVRQPGNVLDPKYSQSDRYLTKEGERPNSVGLCFLSYRGMTLDSKNNPYPLATPDIREGKQIGVGRQALTLSGRAGAWQNYLRAYYYFRDQTQPITQPLVLPVSVLASLQLDRPVSLSLDDHIRRSYLIAKVQSQAPGIDGNVRVRLDVLTLPSGIELGSLPTAPMVWIELKQVFSSRTYQQNGIVYDVFQQALTLTCWQDAQRTQPALVTNLPVTLRAKRTWATIPAVYLQPEKTYEEVQLTYLLNGASSLIEPAFITHYAENPGVNYSVFWDRTIQLDPGEGYSILI